MRMSRIDDACRGGVTGHLIRDTAPLELYTWLAPDADLHRLETLAATPFGAAASDDRLAAVQNYFAEYHLEYYRQRQFNDFPSRLHAQLLFATRVDAETHRRLHPAPAGDRQLVCLRSTGAYIASFHDATWLDYLRLPHSLDLAALDMLSGHYWQGTLVEEIDLRFGEERWQQPSVIEALLLGPLQAVLD